MSSGLIEVLAFGLALVAFIAAVSVENVDWRRHLGRKKDVGSDSTDTNVISLATAREASLDKDADVPVTKRASRSFRGRGFAGQDARSGQTGNDAPIAGDGRASR